MSFFRKFTAVALMSVMLAGCKIEMHSGLNENAANEMLATLLSSGVVASKEVRKDGIALLVEEGQFSQAVELLSARGLPREQFANVSDVFQAEGIVASPLQEMAKLNFARSQEISSSISSIPGVVRVSVNIAEKLENDVFEDNQKPSASVVVLVTEAANADDLVRKIKQIVAFAIPDIEYERVGVLITPVNERSVEQNYVAYYGIMMSDDGVFYANALIAYAAISTMIALIAGVWIASQMHARQSEDAA